jgi:hypothetical protein
MTDQRQNASPMVTASLTAMMLLGAIYFAWLVYRATLPMEIDVNEPWNARHADAAWNGQPLYPDPDGLVANNYPPLSFYLVGAAAWATGCDAVCVGRWLSLAATVALAAGVGACIRWLGASRFAALAAAVWLFATFARFFHGYVGMNDPHLAALAVMTWAMAWMIRRRRSGWAVELAILLMVAAGFVKHNLLAVPLASLAWLAADDWRQAVRAAAWGAGAAALGLAVCGLCYGGDFFRQLFFTPREYSLMPALAGLGRLQWIAPALVIFLVWAWDFSLSPLSLWGRDSSRGPLSLWERVRVRAGEADEAGHSEPGTASPHPLPLSQRERGDVATSLSQRERGDAASAVLLVTILVAVAFVLYFFQKMGAGVDDNAQFELAVAAAIGLGLALDRLDVLPIVRRMGIDQGRLVVLGILVVRLLISSDMAPYLVAISPGFRADLQEQAAVTDAEAARIAAVPGPVVCFKMETAPVDQPSDRTREDALWRAIAFSEGRGPSAMVNIFASPAMTVSRRAGKPYPFDLFLVDQRVKLGQLAPDELRRRLDRLGIRFERVDPRTLLMRS